MDTYEEKDFETENETDKICECGRRKCKGYELDEAWGFISRYEIWYCPVCDG